MKIIKRFEVLYYQYLNEESELSSDAPPLAKDTPVLLALYRTMVLVRMMDAKAIALQRTGKLGTYPSTRGQEAVFVGLGKAMAQSDIFVPYYRDLGTLIQRGVSFTQILMYWGGDERGNSYFEGSEDFPLSVPVGSQPLHAVGAAYALKYRQEKNRAVVVTCGDGATSQGDFYEALNAAGVWNLPLVFVVCNNQWAISIPRQEQTAAPTLAQKAIAAGFTGEQIDGNDVLAVTHHTMRALQNAYAGGGPTLLEMICYRQHDHTTADDASRYEPKDLRETEWKKEPVMRLRRYLEAQGWWTEDQEQAFRVNCAKNIDEAVNDYLSVGRDQVSSMFDYLYAKLPKVYEEQRDMLMAMEKHPHG